jgi:hypothetical protein
MVRALGGVLLLAAWAGVARADVEEDALKILDQGVELYKAKDFVAAREAFAKAHDLVPGKANPYRWLGVTDAALGRCADAVRELDVFLTLVPAGDPRSIEAITIRDRCQTELAPSLGHLLVSSTPGGAEVRLDDQNTPALGKTPFERDLSSGSHVLFLSKAGYEPATRPIQVTRGERASLEVALVARPVSKTGTLVVESAPPGVAVRLDNDKAPPIGVTPLRAPVSIGGHVAYLSTKGYKPVSKGISVGPDELVRVDFTLQRPSYAWVAGVVVPGAVVLAIGLGFLIASQTPPQASMLPAIGAR